MRITDYHRKLVVHGILLLFLVSCSLSASQEQTLNKQTRLYLNAIQNRSSLVLVSMTHPLYVRYVKSKGDDYFKEIFKIPAEDENASLNPVIETIKRKNDVIHVLYTIEKNQYMNFEDANKSFKLVAISDDDGVTWSFLNYKVYQDENICKEIPRILK